MYFFNIVKEFVYFPSCLAIMPVASPYARNNIPQGSVLEPLLFLIYIDGLSGIQLSGSSIVLFADDLLFHRVITCIDDLDCIQNDIDELCNWLSSYKLTLNPRKCKSFIAHLQEKITNCPAHYVCEWRCSGKCIFV